MAKSRETQMIPYCHDSIILKILSFLDLKSALRICFASREWSSLWTAFSTLEFDVEKFPNYQLNGQRDDRRITDLFLSAVYKILCGHTSAKRLEKLSVRYILSRPIRYHVNKWVHMVTKNNALKELSIDISRQNSDHYMHLSRFECSSISVLKLRGCTLIPLYWWPQEFQVLCSLTISNATTVSPVMLQSLLGNLPLLERLEIDNCWTRRAEVLAPYLLNLIVKGHCAIKILAPCLRFKDSQGVKIYFGLQTSGEVDIKDDCSLSLSEQLHIINNFHELSIVDTLLVSAGALTLVERWPKTMPVYAFDMLREMTVRTGLVAEELRGLAVLLTRSPCLQTIKFNIEPSKQESSDVADCLTSVSLEHLKMVTVHGYGGSLSHFQLVQFFLENVQSLKSISVRPTTEIRNPALLAKELLQAQEWVHRVQKRPCAQIELSGWLL